MTRSDENYVRTGDHIFRVLRQAIVSNEIPQRSRLVEEDLAEQFAVSRGPVREALRRLEQDGLVERVRRGMLISVGLSPAERDELHLLRTEIDALAARLVTRRGPAKPWALAEAAIAEMEAEIARSGPGSAEIAIRHLEVHNAINQVCFSSKIAALFTERLGGLLPMLEADYVQQPGYEPVSQHRDLVRLLEGGDEAAAVSAMLEHAARGPAHIVNDVRYGASRTEGASR